MSIKNGIFDMIGRKVKEIIVNDQCQSGPGFHLLIVFDDGAAYEFYGDGVLSSSSYDHGGLAYAKKFDNCRIRRYYRDAQGRNMVEDVKVK